MVSLPLDQLPEVLTVDEAATFLRISRGLAYEAVRTGEIPSVRVGRRLLITKTALLRFLGNVKPKAPSASDE